MITECNVRGNNLDNESAKVLAKIGVEKGIMLFGIKRVQKEADFSNQGRNSGSISDGFGGGTLSRSAHPRQPKWGPSPRTGIRAATATIFDPMG
jgi:hypothetical protein